MKIRFYPKKEVIMAQLQKRYDDIENDLAQAEETLAKVMASSLFVAESAKRDAANNVDVLNAELLDLGKTMVTLASHEPPEVMAEIEV